MTFAPRTWVVGEVVAAATLNQEIRDQFNSFFGAWSTYTPVWGATGTAPAIGNGTINGRYMKVGRTVHFEATMFMGSTSTYGTGSWNITIPFPSATKSTTGNALLRFFDSSAGANYVGVGQVGSNDTAARFFAQSGSTANIATGVPFAWAASDEFRVTGTYEAAS
ncbi:hypothetical protein OHB41_25775 [Streptomyces sp. NBC_01571]|uniref:hypothetical protein n=1 Tax=Streptomyces sp. NBC_01571 TaxID=2975883 RepID=UPI0022567289|nr:hypothetical protein [Streptomyces sp. NBC_01571]MCX4576520.1 hypothetical protein [Streptomyces sp. NBC_01571]